MHLLWCYLLTLGLAPFPPRPTPLLTRPALAEQRVRINDTLVLVMSRPYCYYSAWDKVPTTLWQHAELHGRRGYRQVLDERPFFCSSAGLAARSRTEALSFFVWALGDRQPPCGMTGPLQSLNYRNFDVLTWDVRYKTVGDLVTQSLETLSPYDHPEGFTGGSHPSLLEPYHLLPYWLAREQSRVVRTHRLPSTRQFDRYLALILDPGFDRLLRPAYCPLLARLLRTYQTCPMPPATARQVAQAQRMLAQARNRKSTTLAAP
jgi:hypothetical protein